MEGVKKGVRHVLVMKVEKDFDEFWGRILIPNLPKFRA